MPNYNPVIRSDCPEHRCTCSSGSASAVTPEPARDVAADLALAAMDSERSVLERAQALEQLWLHCGEGEVTPAVSALTELAAAHLQDVVSVVRKKPRESQAVGFSTFWDHVNRLVRGGGVAFADDVVRGMPVALAAANHDVDAATREAAADYVALVASALERAEAAAVLARRKPEPFLPLLPAIESTEREASLQRRELRAGATRPRQQASPGHGWPITSLAPPVAA